MFLLRCDLFSLKECSGQKTYIAKVAEDAQKPRRPFWGPVAAILDFAGGAAVRQCRRCGVTGVAALQALSKCPLRC